MNIQSRREKIKRRSGTGRETTQRKRLDLDVNRGQRTGITFNLDIIDKVDGFHLPGSFFDQVQLPKKNTFQDPIEDDEDEEDEEVTETVENSFSNNSPTKSPSPVQNMVVDEKSIMETSNNSIMVESVTPHKSPKSVSPTTEEKSYEISRKRESDRINEAQKEILRPTFDSPPQKSSPNSPVPETPFKQDSPLQVDDPIPENSPKASSMIEDTPKKQLSPDRDLDDFEDFQTPLKITEISNIEKVQETPKPDSPIFGKTPQKKERTSKKNVSFSFEPQTPHRHIEVDEMTPVKYVEIPNEEEEEEEEIEYYNEVMTAQQEFDESFHPDEEDEEEGEDQEGNKKIEMSGIKTRREKTIKPVHFWKGEVPEFEEGVLKGKKRPKTPQKKTTKKKKVEIEQNIEGKYPVIVKKGRETKTEVQQILQTKDTCIEENYRIIQEDDPTPVSIGIKVAFTNDHIKSGILEIKGKSRKPLQNTESYFEIFYCLAGSAEIQVHQSRFNVSRGSHFMVPPHNNFSILNEKSSVCRFCYFISK